MFQRFLNTQNWSLTGLAIVLMGMGISAIPTPKEKHAGKQGDGRGGWKICDDKQHRRAPTRLSATYDDSNKSLTIHHPADDQMGIFHAAFGECFMEDAEPSVSSLGSVNQFEDVENAAAALRIRPTGHMHQRKAVLLTNGHGYFVADVNVRAVKSTEAFDHAPLRTIASDHSALLWIGRDDIGQLYVALLNLQNFPQTAPSATGRVTVLGAATFVPRDGQSYPAAFARFRDPNRHTYADSVKDERDRTATGWVSCDPGCCPVSIALQ